MKRKSIESVLDSAKPRANTNSTRLNSQVTTRIGNSTVSDRIACFVRYGYSISSPTPPAPIPTGTPT